MGYKVEVMGFTATGFKPEKGKTEFEKAAARKSEQASTCKITLKGNDGVLYTAEITMGPMGFTCEWTPNVPIRNGRGQLKKSELKRYQKARDELIQKTADRLGGGVLLLE